MAELNDATHERIQSLCAEGDALAEQASYPAALQKYWAAWDLLPEPQTDWAAATWILAAIGDANFLGGDFVAGRDNLRRRCAAQTRSAIRFFICDWDNASSSWASSIARRTNWPAPTWERAPKSSRAGTSTSVS